MTKFVRNMTIFTCKKEFVLRHPGLGQQRFARRPGRGGGIYPSAQIQGADMSLRRTACIHPRRAKRKVQVCGDSTVQSDGQGKRQSPTPVLAPHPPLTRSPFPSIGEGLSAVEGGLDFEYRAKNFQNRASNSSLLTPHSSLLTPSPMRNANKKTLPFSRKRFYIQRMDYSPRRDFQS